MKRKLFATAVAAAIVLALPGAALGSEPTKGSTPAQVGMEYAYIPPGVTVDGVSASGEISPDFRVEGNCGWADLDITDVGVQIAKFHATAGSYHGIMVKVEWIIDWINLDQPPTGSVWGTTTQFSPTWGVEPTSWVGTGDISGRVSTLIATHWDGVVCVGLIPWDISFVS
jgi:hypothetical protein